MHADKALKLTAKKLTHKKIIIFISKLLKQLSVLVKMEFRLFLSEILLISFRNCRNKRQII